MNKKTIKKALLLTVCAILLVVASVMGTLAYLTSKDVVTNTFTAGKVKITLDETKVDVYGAAVDPAQTTQENSYILVPGHTYKKDPTVHVVAGSENSYLFVKVDNNIAAYEATDYTNINAQILANGWTAHPTEAGVYYRNYSKASGAADYGVFQNFKVEQTLDNADMPLTQVTVTVTAYAIQADGIATATEAWTALLAQLDHNAAPGHTVVPQP